MSGLTLSFLATRIEKKTQCVILVLLSDAKKMYTFFMGSNHILFTKFFLESLIGRGVVEIDTTF